MKIRIFVAWAAILLAAPVASQDTTPTAFRVGLDVQIRDEDLKDRVHMYLRNELRALGDVEVSSENADYKLFVMVMEMKAGGQRIAYVLGISVTSFFRDGYFDSILDPRLNNAAEVSARLEAVNVYEHQLLSIAGAKEADLIKTVTNAIAKFDREVLAPKRTTLNPQ